MTTGFAYLLPLLLAPSMSPPGLCGFWELWGLQMAPETPVGGGTFPCARGVPQAAYILTGLWNC